MTDTPVPPVLDPSLWLSGRPTTVTVTGTSMAPFLVEGDRLEVVLGEPAALTPGQIVIFVRHGELVVHRFLQARGGLFLEKGDGQARGNWWPWPDVLGVATARLRAGERMELRIGPAANSQRSLARRHLRGHRLQAWADRLPAGPIRRLFLVLKRLAG